MPQHNFSSPGQRDGPPQPFNADGCPDCGAPVAGGRAGCQAIWDALSLRTYQDRALAALHDLAFDAYCMQHLDTYCRSAKSYAAHLARLCCGLEYGGDPAVYAAIQRWLNGRISLVKPERPADLDASTVIDVAAALTGEEFERRVRIWAGSVWGAYQAQQDLARNWIRTALGEHDFPPVQRKP
jgi:hypothetical protein